MEFDYDKFNSLLQNSMSAKQLGELSTEDFDYRVELVEEIFKLWCIAKVTLIRIGNGNGKANRNNNNNKKGPELESETTFKFSDNGKRMLVEAVILEDTSMFIGYSNQKNKIRPFAQIPLADRALVPPTRKEYPYEPYEFESLDELNSYVDIAKNQTIDTLYEEIKSIVKLFNNQEDNKLNLIAADILWSYFQDKFATCHYDLVMGDNGSGKTSIGTTFEATGYRAVGMTDPTGATLFRVLGTLEPGQCTIVADEAERLGESTDIMNIIKTGTSRDKKITRTDKSASNTWKLDWFYPYCYKLILTEKPLNDYKAKGVLDRTLVFTAIPGDTMDDNDITEVMDQSLRVGNKRLQRLYDRITRFRKTAFIYRLLHFKDPVIDIDIGTKRRNRQLCKPTLQLFFETKAQAEVEKIFQDFLIRKNEKKSVSLESLLCTVIKKIACDQTTDELKIPVSTIWEEIFKEIYGEDNQIISDECFIPDLGLTVYKRTVTSILENKFGAVKDRDKHQRSLVFDLTQFNSVAKSYEYPDIRIKCSKKVIEDEGDADDAGDRDIEVNGHEIERENDNIAVSDERENNASSSITVSPLSPLSPVDSQQSPLDKKKNEPDDNRTPVEQMKDIIAENRKYIKKDYADHWSCIKCGKHGDHSYLSTHFCTGHNNDK